MKLPFAFEVPFFDREVHAYDLRLAKHFERLEYSEFLRSTKEDKGTTEAKQNQ